MNKDYLSGNFIDLTLYLLSHQEILFQSDILIDIRLKVFQNGSVSSVSLFVSKGTKEIEVFKLSECSNCDKIEYVTIIDLFLTRLYSHIKPHLKLMDYVHVCPECEKIHVNNSMYYNRNYICIDCIGRHLPSTQSDTSGYVYFFESQLTGLIKIGYSENVTRRRKQIESMQGGKINVLKKIISSPKNEKYLHERFAHLKTQGEWFRPSIELTDFIKDLHVI